MYVVLEKMVPRLIVAGLFENIRSGLLGPRAIQRHAISHKASSACCHNVLCRFHSIVQATGSGHDLREADTCRIVPMIVVSDGGECSFNSFL